MAIPIVEFSREGYKFRFWLKINCSQLKLLNFANWCNSLIASSKSWSFYVNLKIYLNLFEISYYLLKFENLIQFWKSLSHLRFFFKTRPLGRIQCECIQPYYMIDLNTHTWHHSEVSMFQKKIRWDKTFSDMNWIFKFQNLSLVFLLISSLTNGLRLHQF